MCHGAKKTPSMNTPHSYLLRPMVFELRSLQNMALITRHEQMRELLDQEKDAFDAEMRSKLGKSFIKDNTCDRHKCIGWGGFPILK